MSTPTEAPAGRHAKPPAAALVKLTNVGKRYGAVIALHDINMEVGRSPACWATTGRASPP